MTQPDALTSRQRLALAAQYVTMAICLGAIVLIVLKVHNPVFLILGQLLWGGMLFAALYIARRLRALKRGREMDSGDGG